MLEVEMKRTMLLLAAAIALLTPVTSSAAVRGYYAAGGPWAYGGLYGPYWNNYYWGSYPYWGDWAPYAGKVELETKVKTASVFINGSYAGTSKKMKTMYLSPGTYCIELRASGMPHFAEKVYVVAGKTVHLFPKF
jgi:hypothetical protein